MKKKTEKLEEKNRKIRRKKSQKLKKINLKHTQKYFFF